ncbi:ribonuclease HII [Merismopedia glauca CCAP 1448/3]|uniref:Ribonuclease HII n=1 Tax=Merismopedia glauca CCAP 1448/3 TaxID=1296344 RepID=A0A2T1C9X2_9CYAN|nr:ribonuclease HII [Merismopedia glauca CCAP 1448/3]
MPECSYLGQIIAGIDEVGRGALCGPVVAAAVILPQTAWSVLAKSGVRDSKKLSSATRDRLAIEIQSLALEYQIAWADVAEIDTLNILQASLLAMQRAVNQLSIQPDVCLVDGKQSIPNLQVRQENLVKGDERSLTIAAASIVAKVWRDRLMVNLATDYPLYDLGTNKGYGTAKHLQALRLHGASSIHRQSFASYRCSRQKGN